MSDLLVETQNNISVITLNRINKHNAFDDNLLKKLQTALHEVINNAHSRVILLKANGPHFSAGADLAWMKRMATFSEEENLKDALLLAEVMYTLHTSPKPTLAMVQGGAFGGGAGLIAACDIAIAASNARFCFSEVKLGLIPAVISPYIIRAIGERLATWLFMTAEAFTAEQAKQFHLIHHCVAADELETFTFNYARQITQLAPRAVASCKTLVTQVANQPINKALLQQTAALIAKARASAEGQQGLEAFLNKETRS